MFDYNHDYIFNAIIFKNPTFLKKFIYNNNHSSKIIFTLLTVIWYQVFLSVISSERAGNE